MAEQQVNGHSANGPRVAVVTGGASGIGLAITKLFASQGSRVAILDLNQEAGLQVAAETASAFPQATVHFERCDVSSWPDQKAAFASVYDKFGRIDVVMANAGISEQGATSLAALGRDTLEEPSLRTLNVNFVGIVYSVKLAVHYLEKNTIEPGASSKGSIICTASNAGIYPFPMAPMYSASKSAVISLVRSMAAPLSPAKIQINALAPAVIQTNIAPAELFKNMKITPMETLIKGVSKFLENPVLTGEIAEIHGDNVTLRAAPEWVDEDSRVNIEEFSTLGYA